MLPRITRAQSMDVLSSQATVAGYKAVLTAADNMPRMFPMLMTAAGTVTPAKVFVVGAGVAGLMAVAQARKLGAVVEAYDIRPAVKEQVESLGAKFVEMELEVGEAEDKGGYAKAMDEDFYRRQRELMAKVVAASDAVITTAAVPGRKAPVLVTTEMVESMRAGSVVVDLAAPGGGNCEAVKPGEVAEVGGVKVFGPLNLPAEVPADASRLFSGNLVNLLKHLVADGEIALDHEDEITAGIVVTRDGEVVHSKVLEVLGAAGQASE
jgi:NAD(P) transhydrogenase subunit alpha